ncbi:hypothetical protein [Mycoplasma sp. Ms02]|uniref:hypothetical protein n=1 Tax=Mycoplasma sp. Ms02 TaxID=353851 RepID=UPI001C89325C|nr:hypothetical protein [Mycoplasma sp. Ms02]QZE12345.1 hypothetical protein K4L35_03365 [Mycoplasma sp. Ms02]
MSNKNKTLKIALGTAATLAAAAGLSTTAILFSLTSNYKDKAINDYKFNELEEAKNLLQTFANSDEFNALSDEDKKEVLDEIKHSNQLLENKDSSILSMLKKRNQIRVLRAKLGVKVAKNDQQLEKALEDYASLVKDSDLLSNTNQLLADTKSALREASENTKEAILNNFFKAQDAIIEKQDEMQLKLEEKVWEIHENIAKGSQVFQNASEKALINNAIAQVLDLFKQPRYTRDNVEEYNDFFNQIYEQTSKESIKSTQETANFKKVLEKVRSEVESASIPSEQKAQINQRLNEYEKYANNSYPTLATSKKDEINLLEDLVNSELQNLANAQKSPEELRQEINQLAQSISNSQHQEKVQKLIDNKVEQLIQNLDKKDADQLYEIERELLNLQLVTRNLDKLESKIKENLESYANDMAISQDFRTSAFDELNSIFENAESANLNDLSKKLSDLSNKVDDAAVINLSLKNALSELQRQVNVSIEDRFATTNEAQTRLNEMNQELSDLIANPQDTQKLNNKLRELSNELRDFNKEELKNLLNSAKRTLSSDLPLSDRTRSNLESLNSQAELLVKEDSTATRLQLQDLIARYKVALKEAKVDTDLEEIRAIADQQKAIVESIFGDTSKFGDKFQEDINGLTKQAELLALDSSLSQEAKKAKMDELAQKMRDIANASEKGKKLEDALNEAEKALAETTNPAEASILKQQINQIKDLINKGETYPTSPDFDSDQLAEDLLDAVAQFREDQANYQGEEAGRKAIDAINKAFAGTEKDGQKTPLHQQTLDKANELIAKIKDQSLPASIREQAKADLEKLANDAAIAREAEEEARRLEALINRAKETDFGGHLDDADVQAAQVKLDQIRAALNSANTSDITSPEAFQDLIDQSKAAQADLNDKMNRANLEKAAAALDLLKYTGPNTDKSPYQEANASIQALLDAKDTLLAKDPKATEEELLDLQKRLTEAQALARKLKDANELLDTIDPESAKDAYENLKQTILDNVAALEDDKSADAQKIKNLNTEMRKTPLRTELAKKIEALKSLYTEEDRKKAIHADDIAALDELIAKYEQELANPNTTSSRLSILINEATNKSRTQEDQKQAREKEYSDAVANMEALKDQYADLAQRAGLTSSDEVQAIFAEFDRIKDLTEADGKKPTTPQDIKALKDKLELAFQKDLFKKKYDDIQAQIDALPAYSDTENGQDRNVTEQAKEKLKAAADLLKEQVDSLNTPSDLAKVKEDINKLNALSSLTEKQNSVLTYLANNTDSTTSVQQRNNIADSILEEIPQGNTANDITTSGIRKNIEDLTQSFIDNSTLEEAKKFEDGELDKFKTQFDQELAATLPNSQDPQFDPKLQEQFDAKIAQLKEQLSNVDQKSQILPIDSELQKIVAKKDALKEIAETVQKAQNVAQAERAKPETAQDASKVAILDEIDALTKSVQDDYLSLTDEEIAQKKEQITKLLENLESTSEIKQEFSELLLKLDTIQYPNDQVAQFNDQDEITNVNEDARNLFKDYIKDLMRQVDEKATEADFLEDIRSRIPTLERVMDSHIEKINLYKGMAKDADYRDVVWNDANSEDKHTYGFENDYQKLALNITKSVPNKDTMTFNQIEKELLQVLADDVESTQKIYKSRKSFLDTVIGNRQQDDAEIKGFKTVEKEKLLENQTSMPEMYAKLWTRAQIYHDEVATKIKEASTEAQFQDQAFSAELFHGVFDQYMSLAQKIQLAKDAIAEVRTKDQDIQSNQYLAATITRLEQMMNTVEGSQENPYNGWYFKNRNVFELENQAKNITTFTARLKLGLAVAEATKELNAFPEAKNGSDDYLTAEDKAPLLAIINKPFTDLENGTVAEEEETYNNLRATYIEGSTNQSVKIAQQNSINLRKAIDEAQQYWDKYSSEKASSATTPYETERMIEHYEQGDDSLQSILARAKTAIAAIPHQESIKEELDKQITSPTTGIISKLKKQKAQDVRDQLRKAQELNRLLGLFYEGANPTPVMQDYVDVAITPLSSLEASSPDNIATANTNLKASAQKVDAQYAALWTWEKNKYESLKSRYQRYYDLLSQDTTLDSAALTKSELLKASGVSQSDLDRFMLITSTDQTNDQAGYYASLSQDVLDPIYKERPEAVIRKMAVASEELTELFLNIKIASVQRLNLDVTQFDRFANEFPSDLNDTNRNTTMYGTIDKMGYKAALQAKVDAFRTSSTSLKSLGSIETTNADDTDKNYAQVSTANDTNRQAFFDKYSSVLKNVARTSKALNTLIYDENDSLVASLNKFLVGNDSYKAWNNLNNMIDVITKSDATDKEAKFSKAKFEYDKSATTANALNGQVQELKASMNANQQQSRSYEYATIKRAYENMNKFAGWFKNQTNVNLVFDYLNQKVSNQENALANFENLVPLDTTSGEKFKEMIESNTFAEEDKTIDGVQYKAKKLNIEANSTLLELFTQFNVLKGDSSQLFDTNSVSVYVVKREGTANYVDLVLQSDTTIKKAVYNLYFEYKKPSSVTAENSSFDIVYQYGVLYPSIASTFKTKNEIKFNKEMIRTREEMKQPIFTSSEAGWQPVQTPSLLSSGFIKNGHKNLVDYKLPFYVEDVNADIDAENTLTDANKTASTPEFVAQDNPSENSFKDYRFKIKFATDYKGYRQAGDKIYWKPLNPTALSDKELTYKDSGDYGSSDTNTGGGGNETWRNRWYEAYTKKTEDEGKTISQLPIVIAIPMTKVDTGRAAALVLKFTIGNRFDTTPSGNSVNVVINDIDYGFGQYFYDLQDSAVNDATINTPDKFAQTALHKINYPQYIRSIFWGTRIGDITVISADTRGALNETITNGDYTGGIGTDEFNNAIEKFDFKLKLQ